MGNIDRNKTNFILKMDITIWISILLAVITLSTPVLSSEPRVVCYYTNWSVYRPGTARFNPQNINPYLCTHLVYAFGGFTKDNTLKPFDKYQDIEKGGYAKFTGLKTYNKNLKTLLAIGGWNEGSSRFSPMVASRDRRKEFVRNAIKFLRQNRFDGLDLDWEYPAFRDGAKPKDRENYAKLVKELREEFERESEKTNKPRLLLTMAVPAGIEYIQKGFDVKTLNQYLDWMNLLTYDYHSAFEPAVNHHAPLYPLEEPNEYSVDNELNIDYTIKFYLENGADPDKLVLGIPTYGRSYTLFNPDAYEIGSPADGPGEQGDATREKGYLAYYEICEALKPKDRKRSVDSEEDSEEGSEEEEEEPWTVMQPNPKAMGPVAFKGNQWVGYDDIDIVRKKAEYVVENGLGGIMFWSIDNDDFRGNCHGKPYPLIEAAKEAYVGKLGSSDKTVTNKPPSATRSSAKRKNRPKSSTTTTTQKSTTKANKRISSTTPVWNPITPEPPTTPDPGSDFKCVDEGFYPHPRDCKKYFWCLDSGPSNLGIVAHQFTCPSGLFFNKAADSCDFARNVLCKMPSQTTKAPATKAPSTRAPSTTPRAPITTTTRKPVKLSTRNSLLFRTTSTSTTPEPESEEEYEDDVAEDSIDVDAEDPKVIKELIDLIKKVGGIEQLEKQLYRSESSASTDGGATTTPSSFNKKLYQKVLERARGKNKFGNSLSPGPILNRRGPQNAGLEASADKDRLLKKDRPQYTTINRQRPLASNTEGPESEEEEEEEQEEVKVQASRSRPQAESQLSVATTTKPLQYVNIRRARPTITTSDTADDSASRNALFERSEQPLFPVSDTPNSLDILSARRENTPEYVTIRRQRPTTEETTTEQYSEEDEIQATALEREISSQPQYSSIVRSRSTTTPAPEEPSTPEPTTVLAVQISSLLNSPSEDESPEPETTQAQTTVEPTTTTTTTTTPPPSSLPPRRTIVRRRGSTTTTTSAPSSSTQQAPKRSFLRRTKATAPPDGDTESPTVDTTTSKYLRRGGSKFTTRKEAGERPSLNASGAPAPKRADRLPPRGFARRRPNNTSAIPIVASSTAIPLSRRPLFAKRQRPVSTTTTTTTTEAATTTALEEDESLQDIGDTDVIEDPTLEPRAPKKSPKVQRRPLVSLKEEVGDQNPSATNEEERKRQSKKYSASIKQNQLDDLLKLKTNGQESTTEYKTTLVDEISAETALAIAAHQLLKAPVPSLQEYDETRSHTTPDYKHDPDSKDLEYPSTTPYLNPTTEYVTTTQNNDPTLPAPRILTTTATPMLSYDIELTGTPAPTTTLSSNDDISETQSTRRFTSRYSAVAEDTSVPKSTLILSTDSNLADTQTTKLLTYDNEVTYTVNPIVYSDSEFSDTPRRKSLRKFSTENYSPDTLTTPKTFSSRYTTDYDVTEYRSSETPTRKSTYTRFNSDTEKTLTFTPSFSSGNEYATPTAKTAIYSTFSPDNEASYTPTPKASTSSYADSDTDTPTEYYSPKVSASDFTPSSVPRGSSRFSTAGLSTIKAYSDTPVRFGSSRTSPATSFSSEPTTLKDSTQDYLIDSTLTYTSTYNPPRSSVNTPETTSNVNDYSNTPTELNAPSTFARKPSTLGRLAFTNANVVTSGLSAVSQNIGSTRFTSEKYIPISVQGFDYSTPGYTGQEPRSRSPEPAYFTREYLLESPVTKTYDDEYQYLSPITTPTTSTTTQRRIIRKKLQRRISTTLRPTTAIAPRVTTQYVPLTTPYLAITTPKPRRVSTKKPFEKILKADPPRTFRPIVNYDYYDDSEEKVAEKYVEGTKVVVHSKGTIECLDIGNFPHPTSCKKFISCARMEGGAILGWEYICPKGLSFDPVGAICNWSAGLGCDEKDV